MVTTTLCVSMFYLQNQYWCISDIFRFDQAVNLSLISSQLKQFTKKWKKAEPVGLEYANWFIMIDYYYEHFGEPTADKKMAKIQVTNKFT